jgi:hypothetical protein
MPNIPVKTIPQEAVQLAKEALGQWTAFPDNAWKMT